MSCDQNFYIFWCWDHLNIDRQLEENLKQTEKKTKGLTPLTTVEMARGKAPAGRQKNAVKRRKDANTSVSEAEGPASQGAAATAVTDFFKSMNNSVRSACCCSCVCLLTS